MRFISRSCAATALCLLAAATLTSVAKADTMTTFNVAGTFDSGAKLSGTVLIDTTVGSVTAANLAASSPYFTSFTTVGSQTQNFGVLGNEDLVTFNGGSYTLYLAFLSNTLVGYQGGALGGNSVPGPDAATDIAFNGEFVEDLYVGSATAPAAITPEPSSLLLLATGLLGGAGACVRRLRAS